MMPPDGKIGPIEVGGTLTAEDREEIWQKTSCSAAVRGRGQKARALTVSGPVSRLEEAHRLAMGAIQKNIQLISEGKKLPSGGAEFKGSEERKAAAQARRAAWEIAQEDVPGQAHAASGSDGWGAHGSKGSGSSTPAAQVAWTWNAGWSWLPVHWHTGYVPWQGPPLPNGLGHLGSMLLHHSSLLLHHLLHHSSLQLLHHSSLLLHLQAVTALPPLPEAQRQRPRPCPRPSVKTRMKVPPQEQLTMKKIRLTGMGANTHQKQKHM